MGSGGGIYKRVTLTADTVHSLLAYTIEQRRSATRTAGYTFQFGERSCLLSMSNFREQLSCERRFE